MKDHRPIGEMLLEAGIISPTDLEEALDEQRQSGLRLCSILIRKGLLKPSQLTNFLRKQFGVAAVDLSGLTVRPEVLNAIPPYFANLYQVFPINLHQNTMTVAMMDPSDQAVVRSLEEITGYTVDPVISPQAVIRDAVAEHYRFGKRDSVVLDKEDVPVLVIRDEPNEIKRLIAAGSGSKLSSLEWLERIFLQAVKNGSREIHIEGGDRNPRIRLRVKEKNVFLNSPPYDLVQQFFRHLELISQIPPRLGRSDVPKHGRFHLRLKGRRLTVLVSSFPVISGRRLILKLVNEGMVLRNSETLGMEPEMLSRVQEILKKPVGLLILVSPPGGGKRTTLYSLMGLNLKDGKIIMTLEPSIEYPIKSFNQAILDPESGFTMPEALKAVSQQNPDVIGIRGPMTTEDRDLALSIATRCLVIMALEARNIFGVFDRFRSDLLAEVFLGGLAQRVVHRLCPDCKRAFTRQEDLPVDVAERLTSETMLYTVGNGCPSCRYSGYQEITGIFEALFPSVNFIRLLEASAPASVLRRQASSDGVIFLREKMISLALSGDGDVEELIRFAPPPISSWD